MFQKIKMHMGNLFQCAVCFMFFKIPDLLSNVQIAYMSKQSNRSHYVVFSTVVFGKMCVQNFLVSQFSQYFCIMMILKLSILLNHLLVYTSQVLYIVYLACHHIFCHLQKKCNFSPFVPQVIVWSLVTKLFFQILIDELIFLEINGFTISIWQCSSLFGINAYTWKQWLAFYFRYS